MFLLGALGFWMIFLGILCFLTRNDFSALGVEAPFFLPRWSLCCISTGVSGCYWNSTLIPKVFHTETVEFVPK